MRMLAPPRLRGLLLVVGIVALAGCTNRDPVSRGTVTAFGTTMEITLIGVDRQRAAEVTRILEGDLQTMERAWHAWEPGPLSRMNELISEGVGPFAAPPSVLPLLRLSKALSESSDDLFNPAIGHLFKAWGFQGRRADCLRPPEPEAIEELVRARPSMHDVSIDGFRVTSSNPMVRLDFRAIQRGFAIDQAIARLQELGIDNASINAEGSLRAIGSRGGHAWSVPLRGPERGGILGTLQILGNEAAFTTVTYKTNFSWEGRLYHDVIDPRTGYPAEGATSVTVLHPNASTADAAATALFIAGPADWHRIAKRMGIRYVMLTDNQGRVHMNPAMQARVKLHASNREVVISEPLT